MQTAYVLVSPCKDEAEYIEKTLRSIARQTVKPVQWVIVDDGSRDDSMTIVAQYQAELPFIKVVQRDTGARQVGAGVIQAFNAGLAAVDVPYDVICKFDVDLELPERYFEIMLERMAADPRLGTCSGKAYYRHPKTGAPVSELCGDETSVGMIKFYRRACFEAIGGFVADNGWDMFDGHQARWHGWRAGKLGRPGDPLHPPAPDGVEPEEHHHGRARHGDAQYRIGSHPCSSPPPRSTGRSASRPTSPAPPTSCWAISGRCSRARAGSATMISPASSAATSSGRCAPASARPRNGPSASAPAPWPEAGIAGRRAGAELIAGGHGARRRRRHSDLRRGRRSITRAPRFRP